MDSGKTANLFGMAMTAQAAGNHEEALSYFNRVLEEDPSASEAWLGKGVAAGWLSSLSNVRTAETLVAFGHAIATTPTDDKPSMAERAHSELTKLCSTLYGMARKNFTEHPTVTIARATYLRVSSGLLDTLASAQDWRRSDRSSLDLTVLISRQLLDFGLTPESNATIRSKMDKANSQIEALDPDYKRPQLASQTIVEKEQAKASSDALGYIVAFVLLIVLMVMTSLGMR